MVASRYPRNNPLRPAVATRIWCALFSCLTSTIELTYTQQIYNHGRSYNEPNTGSRSHVMEPSRAPMPSVQQQQQHYSSFNASTLVNQNIHPQRDTNYIRPIGGVGAVATVGYCKSCKS